jgi:L-lactate dehydrogenase complex protein LldG
MSREKILDRIRRNKPTAPLSVVDKHIPETLNQQERENMFVNLVRLVGGEVIILDNRQEADLYQAKYYGGIPDFGKPDAWNEFPNNCSKEKLDSMESAVLDGQAGVAENGAIWLDDRNFPNRLIPFIVQHLVIRLSRENILANMHEAYEKIDTCSSGFGLFLSGPSKTADIEQSLVYGAHGAKGLTVLLYGETTI